MTIEGSLIVGGQFDGKYYFSNSGNLGAIEYLGDNQSSVKFPDIFNSSTTGSVDLITTPVPPTSYTIEELLPYTSKNGLPASGEIVLNPLNGLFAIIADNLTDGALTAYFFSPLDKTPYGNFTSYLIDGVASDFIS